MQEPISQSISDNNAAHFRFERDDVFARIASRYDLLSDIFSLYIHRHWKRKVAQEISTHEWQLLLDSASGTGDIVLRIVRNLKNLRNRRIIASDVSEAMLSIAHEKLPLSTNLSLVQLDAHSMPSIVDSSIDLYSISLGLKICNRTKVFQEAIRVLRPGGTFISLEASNIPFRLAHRAYLLYMRLCMPILGWIATGGDASAYRYLLAGIEDFPAAEALADEMRAAGFENVHFKRLSLGIVAIHVGKKSSGQLPN